MSEYRIIRNARGYIPQRYGFFGWDGISSGSGWWGGPIVVCRMLENAREAIREDMRRRLKSTDYHTGGVVEYYNPKVEEVG